MGQTQPVKAVFAVYKDAMEAQALAYGLSDRDQPGADPCKSQNLVGLDAGTPGG